MPRMSGFVHSSDSVMRSHKLATLALGFTALSSFLAPGSAQAQVCTGNGTSSGSFLYSDYLTAGSISCAVGDKTYTFNNGDIAGAWAPGTQFLMDENMSDPSIHTLRVLPGGGALGAGTYTFNYQLAVTTGTESLAMWGMGSQLSQGSPSYSFTTTTSNSADSPASLPGPGVDVNNNYNTPYQTTASWTNTVVVTGSGAVGPDSLTNSVTQTPGPLPILGAGAAFAFSRKLRTRIKSAC